MHLKNWLFLFYCSLLPFFYFSQQKGNIYCIHGQGSDKRLFDSLKLDTNYSVCFIEYGTPEKNTSMKEFAETLIPEIDTSECFVLIGVSMGGMICAELNEIIQPEKVILISSAQNESELPFRYRFQKKIPLYRLFPGKVLFAGAKIMQPIVEPDRNQNKETFKSMLYAKNPIYIKRTINLIIQWEKTSFDSSIYQIHGTKDHTLPSRNLTSVAYTIENGSHMMTLTRADEISLIINQILSKE